MAKMAGDGESEQWGDEAPGDRFNRLVLLENPSRVLLSRRPAGFGSWRQLAGG
jgi:hypothetical protein